MVEEEGVALFALPSHSCPRLPPCSSEPVELLFRLRVTVRLCIARVASRPFGEFGRFAGALGASDVFASLADGSRRGRKEGFALVTGTSDALPGRLVGQLGTGARGDGEHLASFDLVGNLLVPSLFLVLVLVGHGCRVRRRRRRRRLLLGIAWALFATLMLTLPARLVGPVHGSAAVAATVDSQPNRLFHPLNGRTRGRGHDPVMGVEREAIFGEEGAGSLLLHDIAVELLDHG